MSETARGLCSLPNPLASGTDGAEIEVAMNMTLMKTFLFTLRDNREIRAKAQSYHREGDQYLLDGTESGEVELVVAGDVIGITVVPPDESEPIDE